MLTVMLKVSYLDLADACTTGILYGLSLVILLLFVQTTQILLQFSKINVLEIFGGHVLISRQYHLMFLALEHDV